MKISVLTPSYNSGKYIETSIASVLAQGYTNWEHIVVDGLSSDNTVEILKKHAHINWISEKDCGQSDAMNKAFGLCTGDLIVYLNADDYFYPDAFQIIVDKFKDYPSADIIVGNLDVDRNGVLETSTNATILWQDLSIIKGRFPLNPVSYFYKRKVQETIGNFPNDEHYTMDYWFLIRAFYLFKPVKIEDVLGCFVFDGNNKTSVIVDGFSIQMPHALRFTLKYTPKRFFKVYYNLLKNKRNKTREAVLLRKVLKKLSR